MTEEEKILDIAVKDHEDVRSLYENLYDVKCLTSRMPYIANFFRELQPHLKEMLKCKGVSEQRQHTITELGFQPTQEEVFALASVLYSTGWGPSPRYAGSRQEVTDSHVYKCLLIAATRKYPTIQFGLSEV